MIIENKKFESLCKTARELAGESEAARALPPQFARKLAAAGLLAMFLPKSSGIKNAREDDPLTACAHLKALAHYDTASAWVAMIGSTASFGAAYLEPDVAVELFGGDKITCGIFAPNGVAQTCPADDDFYIVSGRWSWASGSANADTIGLGCLVEQSGQKSVRLIIAPREDVIFHDDWHSLGLRGTSSGGVELKQARIKKSHSYRISDAPHSSAALYRMPYFGLLAAGVAAVALGNAERALEIFLELATAKTPAGARSTLAQKSRVQSAYAEAQARLCAADDYYWATLARIWEKAQADKIGDEDKAALRLAATHIMRESLVVIRTIHDLAGGSAVFDSHPLQKSLRDAETMSQHMITAPATYDMVGKVLLTGEGNSQI